MKIRSLVAELFHAGGRTDGQADVTKLIMASRNFVNAPKNFRNTLSEPNIELLALNLVAHKETIAP
jgi:hypothetical protein